MFKKNSAQNADEPMENASAREFLDIKIKLPDTKEEVHIVDKKGHLVKSPNYDPVAQARKHISLNKNTNDNHLVNIPDPNKDIILKQKQAKIDVMRKKLRVNKTKISSLN